MTARLVTMALTLSLAAPVALAGPHGTPADQEAPVRKPTVVPCTVTLSGAVKGSFKCQMGIRTAKQGVVFSVTPGKLPPNIPAFMAGPIELAGTVKPGTYGTASIKAGRVLLNDSNHVSFGAEVGKPPRGELTLTLKSVEMKGHDATAKGTLVAKLVSADAKNPGEVAVTIKF
jgi:hypothetical protein